jgi:hypothetical protein
MSTWCFNMSAWFGNFEQSGGKKKGQLGQITAIHMLTSADRKMQQQIKEREIKIAAIEGEIRPLFEQVQALARAGKGKSQRARALLKQIAPLETRLNKQLAQLDIDKKILATASDITEEVDGDEARAEMILALKGATPHIGGRSTKSGETLNADDIDDIFANLTEARQLASTDGGTIRSALTRHLNQTDMDASIDANDSEAQTVDDDDGLTAMMSRLGGRFGADEEEDEVVQVDATKEASTSSTTTTAKKDTAIPMGWKAPDKAAVAVDTSKFPTHPKEPPVVLKPKTTSRGAIAEAEVVRNANNKTVSRTRHIIFDDDEKQRK